MSGSWKIYVKVPSELEDEIKEVSKEVSGNLQTFVLDLIRTFLFDYRTSGLEGLESRRILKDRFNYIVFNKDKENPK